MAEIRLKLKYNKTTGKKLYVIKYEGDGDELPHEHEETHREIVESLIAKGILDENSDVRVEVEDVDYDLEPTNRNHDKQTQSNNN